MTDCFVTGFNYNFCVILDVAKSADSDHHRNIGRIGRYLRQNDENDQLTSGSGPPVGSRVVNRARRVTTDRTSSYHQPSPLPMENRRRNGREHVPRRIRKGIDSRGIGRVFYGHPIDLRIRVLPRGFGWTCPDTEAGQLCQPKIPCSVVPQSSMERHHRTGRYLSRTASRRSECISRNITATRLESALLTHNSVCPSNVLEAASRLDYAQMKLNSSSRFSARDPAANPIEITPVSRSETGFSSNGLSRTKFGSSRAGTVRSPNASMEDFTTATRRRDLDSRDAPQIGDGGTAASWKSLSAMVWFSPNRLELTVTVDRRVRGRHIVSSRIRSDLRPTTA